MSASQMAAEAAALTRAANQIVADHADRFLAEQGEEASFEEWVRTLHPESRPDDCALPDVPENLVKKAQLKRRRRTGQQQKLQRFLRRFHSGDLWGRQELLQPERHQLIVQVLVIEEQHAEASG